MTTKITVDAHAGWDVAVKIAEKREGDSWFVREEIVPKLTQRDFYVHSGMEIWGVREVSPL